ncbi:hypothetical protein FOA43_003483 [Brettanomyces nanus]|uniref:Uncharacterized protein n=1 Tax=Eeniella nana TaxID=13502 RepID=A0A875RW66_EENNA|nr:uncharacterized protein FOA43_003483 [Brettanomyces nanus]QPG76097.1 hypothetical protein FOA43_003483 [Brettanomyces nanus]
MKHFLIWCIGFFYIAILLRHGKGTEVKEFRKSDLLLNANDSKDIEKGESKVVIGTNNFWFSKEKKKKVNNAERDGKKIKDIGSSIVLRSVPPNSSSMLFASRVGCQSDDCNEEVHHHHKKTIIETTTEIDCDMDTVTETEIAEETTTVYEEQYTTREVDYVTDTEYDVITETDHEFVLSTKTILEVSMETITIAKKTVTKKKTKTETETETETEYEPTTRTKTSIEYSTTTKSYTTTLTTTLPTTTTATITNAGATTTIYGVSRRGSRFCAIASRFGFMCVT